jgi:DNA-binding transcriptional regulator WhiA
MSINMPEISVRVFFFTQSPQRFPRKARKAAYLRLAHPLRSLREIALCIL